jgi:hypothetical protein
MKNDLMKVSSKNIEQPLCVVVYPLWLILTRNTFPMIVLFVMDYMIHKAIRTEMVVIITIWFALFYLIGQYRYARYSVYHDRVRKQFIASFYLKDREYFFSDVKLFYFLNHKKSGRGDDRVTLYLRNGKRKRFYIPKDEIFQIRRVLNEMKIPVQSTDTKWDKPEFA